MMKKDLFKDMFLSVIEAAQAKYKFELCHHVIMHNHIHLMIKTLEGEAQISRIMQYIKARFAERFNKFTGRIGPFWNERYKSKIIEDSSDPVLYFNYLLWYFAYNPVIKKISGSARGYTYSSIKAYLDEKYISPVQITLHEFYYKLGNTFEERMKKLLIHEEAFLKRRSWLYDWA
jgi:REP element-mobilizing transposase RayT